LEQTVASTITNVSSNINISFPLPGVDNDSQGFRSNFTSIKNSLQVASDEISRLQSSTSNPDYSDSDYIGISSNTLFFGTTNQDQYDSGYDLAAGAFILGQATTPSFYGMASADQDIAIVAKEDGAVRIGPIEGLTEIHKNNIKTSRIGDKFEVQVGTTTQALYDADAYKVAFGRFELANSALFYGLGSPTEDIAIVAKEDGAVRIGPIGGLTEIHFNNIKTSLTSSKFEVQMGTLTGAEYSAGDFKIAFGKFIFDGPPPETFYGIGAPNDDIAIVAKSNGILRMGPFDALIEVGQTFVRPSINNQKSLGSADYRWSAVFSTNGTIQTSDSRLKTDIVDLKLGLDFVNNLRPVSFKRTDDTDQLTHWGLVAQEVKQTIDAHGVEFAGWTESQDEHKTQMLNYSEFVSPLIKAVQELSIENQELRSQLDAIKLHLGL
jgi:hypothetical protein